MVEDVTPLDEAIISVDASDIERLAFYRRFAATELFVLQESDADDTISPRVFETAEGRFLLAFDREDRLAGFAGVAPYVALSGRALAGMIVGQGIGIVLNAGATSEYALPGDAVTWLVDTLAQAPRQIEALPDEIASPHTVPEALLMALNERLALTGGLAEIAYLASARIDGLDGHILAFINPVPGAEEALAQVVGEALSLSGVEAGSLDILFLKASDGMAARLSRHALRFDLPKPSAPKPSAAPGSDPEKPPILR